ncbi:hypothetical protein MMC13_001889 [Lambiella insularis]|nr:hypothetical protein [Lambiella insularis]
MLNPYSHARVLAHYEHQGLIGRNRRLRSTHHSPSADLSTPRHSRRPREQQSKLNIRTSATSESVPRHQAASHGPFNPPPPPPPPTQPVGVSRSATGTSPPITSAETTGTSHTIRSPRAHSRQNSNNGTVTSVRSTVSTLQPAPSIVTQIYSPRVASSLPRVLIPSENLYPALSVDLAVVAPAVSEPLLSTPQAESSQAPGFSPCPPATIRMSSASSAALSIVTAHEPSLVVSCPAVLSPAHSLKHGGSLNRLCEPPLPGFVPSNSITPFHVSCPDSETLPSIGKDHFQKSQRHSRISSQKRPVDLDSDSDSELYFGSADDTSDDSSSSPVSSPTSVEFIKSCTEARLTSTMLPALPVCMFNPSKFKDSMDTNNSPQSLVRGYSSDDAAPPPIARIRSPAASRPALRPLITKSLGSLKPTFSLKSRIFRPLRSTSSLRPRSTGFSGGSTSVGSFTQGMMTEKARRKLEKRARKELLACSVPNERCMDAKSPTRTSDVTDLMPVGRGWTWSSYESERKKGTPRRMRAA